MTPREIGRIVRAARQSLGLRQSELAGAANVGVRFIIDIESGKAGAHLGKVLTVLDALGCRVSIEQPRKPDSA